MESFYFLHLFLFANKKISKSELGEIDRRTFWRQQYP